MQISLEQAGINVEAISSYTNARQILQQAPPEVFILDIDLRGGDSEKLISTYRGHRNRDNGTVMVSTAHRLEDRWRREYRPDTVLYKPFDMRYLIRMISLLTKNKSVPV
jgi:DNA-binding response OmpR family regulator